MKKSDIGVVVFIYAIVLLFYVMTLGFPPEVQIYPTCLIAGLALLNTLYLVISLKKSRKAGFINDFPEVFEGFLKNQFFMILIGCIIYLVLMYLIGFYLSSVIFLVSVLYMLRVSTTSIFLTVAVLGVIIYLVFSRFLHVPLPLGIVFA